MYYFAHADSGAAHLIWTPVPCGVKYLLTITSCPRSGASVLLQRNYTSSNIMVQLSQEKTRDGICVAVRPFDAVDRTSIFHNNTNCLCACKYVCLSVCMLVCLLSVFTFGLSYPHSIHHSSSHVECACG